MVGFVITSLGSEGARLFIQRYGVRALLTALEAWNQYRGGQAFKQQEQAFNVMENEILKLVQRIESKDIRVISGAFNSSAAFTAQFQTAALLSLPLVLLDISSAIKKIGSSLKAISHELAISNVARIQGWETDGFGAHVYRFVRNEMLQVQVAVKKQKRRDRRHHYFYVWNPDTDWYPTFEEKNKASPLGPNFGGYHQELTTICMRMRTDREILIRRTSYGHTAEFHLLVPSYSPLVIERPIAFHESLLPLTITGQRHRDVDFVWFNLHQKPQELHCRCVGVLEPGLNTIEQASLLSGIGCSAGFVMACAATAIFPPCIPVAEPLALACWSGGVASWCTGAVNAAFTSEEMEVLGDPILFDGQSLGTDQRWWHKLTRAP